LASLDSQIADENEGEILVRCPGLFTGYYSPWTPAESVLEEGWYRTGDIGAKDTEGNFRMVGRTKNIINVGAVKVFPSEIEQILCAHPAVEEALVYGAPDSRFGESPRAKVKLKSAAVCDRNDLLAFVNRQLSLFAALRDLDYVDALPKTVTGKLKRSGV
jgi:acyl-CoA synthetase (AMP-forming)/AMP-acid ligase II